ncbi:uncharacterized protein KIAA1958 isoform X2 [Latimeria chalumnae]|uniref:uncharacterized protein KIAA1958 isoform X2 n=1 Tax=Latimeria chalumnae TaxID=7897 RepID=UPI0003C13FD0|nr:PREDICTED: uncharacterized protein KIAA1958 homolog isoform X2 [Latimeria chalumnae]|eukprot:XP_005993567.1 PREDICTED: uncharacterized protein KIAA1958 homolog isoform X2 [Latimeria chalumnae]
MEDCLHTSSENLSKLVSWAHSHGTICNLIPNLKHLLSEGTHGNLTAMWGCSAGHAYHWPLTATCRAGSQERVCFQDNRSFNSDSPSVIGVPSETNPSPVERYPGRSAKGKMDCNRTRDSCDFSYCSEPSEVGEHVEEYEDEATLFDMVCESSVTDEESEFDSQMQDPPSVSRKRPGSSSSSVLLGSQSQVMDENSNDVIVKKIKQEIPEDYYIVANAELTGSINGPALSLTQTPKHKAQTQSGSPYAGPSKLNTHPSSCHVAEIELQNVPSTAPAVSKTVSQRSVRGSAPSLGRMPIGAQGANQQLAFQMPVSTSGTNQQINIPLSALQLPGQEEPPASEDAVRPIPKPVASCEVSLSPPISTEPEVSSSQQQQPNSAQNVATDSNSQELPDARQKDGSEYEPNSLANYQCGLERYLKEHKYGYSITRDKEFKRSQEALKQKQLELRCKGKGNKPHKSMKLTFADELILRKRGLLSRYNPEGLLNLVWLNNTKAFGHCTGFHGSTLKWGDIRLQVTETGLEYLEWMGQEAGDINAKTKRTGTECRIYATPHSSQTCPVQDYKEYAQRRPPAMRYEDAPFYLSIKPVVNLAALHWYNCQALGKNKLAKMVKTMCEKGNIPGRKTNFSVYQSCSTLSEAQSNQLVLICNNLSQQAAQSMASHPNSGNFIVSASYDSSSDTA